MASPKRVELCSSGRADAEFWQHRVKSKCPHWPGRGPPEMHAFPLKGKVALPGAATASQAAWGLLGGERGLRLTASGCWEVRLPAPHTGAPQCLDAGLGREVGGRS